MTRPALLRARHLALAALASLAGGCQEPPTVPAERVAGPPLAREREDAAEFRRRAHVDAFEAALPDVLAALKAADPFVAWQVGLGPAASPPLTLGDRLALAEQVDAAERILADVDETALEPAQVVILRAVRFGIGAINDELDRRPRLRQDPVAPLRSVAAVLDELRYRLVHDDCDAACEGLAADLAAALPSTRDQLAAASPAASRWAAAWSERLAADARRLGERPLVRERPTLAAGLAELAAELDRHQTWLTELVAALPQAKATHVWTANPAPIRPGGVAAIERLPDVLGAQALSRLLTVEERLFLAPEQDVQRVAEHVRRWALLRAELVPAGTTTPGAPTVVDEARCRATVDRITAGLVDAPGVAAPELDCARLAALLGDDALDDAALTLLVLDLGVIEPQRRALRTAELGELALVHGQWSTQVHQHLRRVMLLARLQDPAATSRALDAGARALCMAEAALWVHAELGLPRAVRDAVGSKCALLGEDPQPLLDELLGDPRGALAGLGLSLIGDEPAQMVGFDRFYWAPLGLMQTLATPPGMHPDQFTLPSQADQDAAQAGPVDLKFEDLTPQRNENWGQ